MATGEGDDAADASSWKPMPTLFGGYPPEIFAAGYDQKFLCCHCSNILKDPFQGFCGHRLCKSCVEHLQVTNLNPVVCPGCVTDMEEEEPGQITFEKMFPDNAIKREMFPVPVKCSNPECSWTGPFRDYIKHQPECRFQAVVCGCGKSVPLHLLPEHQEKDCPNRTITCKYCNQKIKFSQRTEHNNSCPKNPIKCDSCGKKKIPRDQFEEHLRECPTPRQKCLLCEELVEVSKMDQHLKSNVAVHFVALATKQSQFQEIFTQKLETGEFENLRACVSDMLQKVNILERHIQAKDGNNLAIEGAAGGLGDGQPISNEQIVHRMKNYEDVLIVFQLELRHFLGKFDERNKAIAEQDRKITEQERIISIYQEKIRSLEKSAALREVSLAEMDLRVQSTELTSYNGVLVWKIKDFNRKRQDAILGRITSLYSPAFYTDRTGYKMCARLYLNGDGLGKGSHLSLFFVLMRSHYDALLKFPFKQKVTLMLLDQSNQDNPNHVIDAFRPDPISSSFSRPTNEMNIASGCPLFMKLDDLMREPGKYVSDDTLFIKVVVDCSGQVSA